MSILYVRGVFATGRCTNPRLPYLVIPYPVASLGLVSRGAATDGVTLFSHRRLSFLQCHPYFLLTKTDDLFSFFCLSLSLLLISLGCHPLEIVNPQLFLPVNHRLSTILCKFSHIFSFGCHPPGGCYPGVTPPLPSDATDLSWRVLHLMLRSPSTKQ